MDMVQVSSSNLNAVGYDTSTKRLVIQFNDSTYEYYDVPNSVYQGLLSASSKGKYHHQFIKNAYRYKKLGRNR